MVASGLSKAFTNYVCDSLDTLALEAVRNKGVDYKYNVYPRCTRQSYPETGKKLWQPFVYDVTDQRVES